MASLFRDRTLGHSKRDSFSSSSSTATTAATTASPSSATSRFTPTITPTALSPLPPPLVTSPPLSPTPISAPLPTRSSYPPTKSLTSAAASKMKKALGLRSSSSRRSSDSNNPVAGGKTKRPVTIGELMRVQMRVSEASDSRIRRGLLRISAGQVGRRTESMILPLELLQQFKASDFTDQAEYEAWQKRNLRMLEAGLLLHPHMPLEKANTAAQRLRQIIHAALDRPIETGRNNESMQVLRTTVMALASRTSDGAVLESCHWADGFPLNLRLYEMLLEACFDINDETSILEEVDELMELIKKTWGILGLNQMLHNLCFTWVLFNRYVASGQVEIDLLYAADSQLSEVAKDVKMTKDPVYSKILSSTLTAMLGWAEKRLLAYHETFDSGNIDSMQSIVSVGVLAAKILVEDISNEYRRRKNEVDVALSRIDTYIRSSLRTAFAQRMEKADSSRRASRNQPNPLPVLAILAKDVGELAIKEKDMFSPILKRWHPFAAGVAVATLHACYGNELKQFISGITELTPDAVQILRAADKLEKDLVQIAVEDSVDSDDGGKAIIREMPPYEAEGAIANLVKVWIKTRLDRLKEWVDRNLQQEQSINGFSICRIKKHVYPHNASIDQMHHWDQISVEEEREVDNLSEKEPQVATVNGDSSCGLPQLCVRINSLHKIRMELEVLEKRIITLLRNSESAHVEDFSNGLGKKFELTPASCVEAVQQLSEGAAYKIVFHDLSHALWDSLYVGDPSSSRIEPFLQELEHNLTVVADTVHERVRTRIIADIMRASFDGFLLVLLAGGPTRSFSPQDSQIIEDDFRSLKDLFWANGDGLPDDVIDKFSTTARNVLPLFRADTDSLIERFRRLTLEAYGSSAKSRLPLPPTSGQWNPTEPNTLLRVLCYRNDEAATKFLKKTYNLPKKL
ncbi:UNVERIFIED_CONTAM: protein unc-13 [Sesamum radiatum]|uniref:Protein unc-13 n=1 Tax=Sesamum radiatum TaxID=300843 RepID=A0AAW2MGF9_SESRA